MSIESLTQRLGYQFNKQALLIQALTHRSFSANNNERLEFLGDGALNFIIANQLYSRFKQLSEGDLSRLRAALVKESTLAEIAISLNLGELLMLGEGEIKSAGYKRPSTLSDALEAVVGAIYIDGGYEAAQKVVVDLFQTKLLEIDPKVIDKDAKSQLQEYLQGKKIDLPDYTVVLIKGEAHAQTFKVQCSIEKLKIETIGEGNSRRIAEQRSAQFALDIILSKISDTQTKKIQVSNLP